MIATDEKQFAHIMNEKLVIITKNLSSKHSSSSKDSDSDFFMIKLVKKRSKKFISK